MNHLMLAPAALHLLAAALNFFPLPASLRRVLCVITVSLSVAFAAGMLQQAQVQSQVVHVGGWAAPFGIALVNDVPAALFTLLFCTLSLLSLPYLLTEPEIRGSQAHFILLHGLLLGVCATPIAGDLFNLYVWFELMFVCGFLLMVSCRGQEKISSSLHYLFANLITTIALLLGITFVYAMTQSLNLAHVATVLKDLTPDQAGWAYLMIFAALAMKIGLFPFFFWLPLGYGATSHHLTVLIASVMTKVALAVLFRLHYIVFHPAPEWVLTILQIVACASMAVAVLAASIRSSFREILSVHISSQLGYILAAMSLQSPAGTVAAIFYLIKHSIAKSGLLMIQSIVAKATGRDDVFTQGGFIRSSPILTVSFVLLALGLAGLPPLAGFWAKFLVLKATYLSQNTWLFAIALITGLYTAWSMLKILLEVFLKKGEPVSMTLDNRWISVFTLAIAIVIIGVVPEPLLKLCEAAAASLNTPENYINLVLSTKGS